MPTPQEITAWKGDTDKETIMIQEVSAKIEIFTGMVTTQKGNLSKNRNEVSEKEVKFLTS